MNLKAAELPYALAREYARSAEVAGAEVTLLHVGELAFEPDLRHGYDLMPPLEPDLLVGIESRGFLVAAPLSYLMGCGFIMVRKRGKLPGDVIQHHYDLEYGTDVVEVQSDAIEPGQRVVVLDDLLATGGTLSAAISLLQNVGANVVGAACIIELSFLGGRGKLNVPFKSMVSYES